MRFNDDDLVALDSIVRFDPLLETGVASPDLGINMARKRSIHYAGFPVRMKQALLRELEWLESVVQCVTRSMTTSLQYRVNIVTTSSTCVEPGFCS